MAEDQQTPSNLSKSEAIAQIQSLINQLQGVAAQLEADPAEDWGQTLPLDELTETVAQLTAAMAPIDSAPIEPEAEPLPPTETPTEPEDWGLEPAEDDGEFTNESAAQSQLPPDEIPEPKGLDKLLPTFSQFLRMWNQVLAWVRDRLPAGLNEKLSDWALTGVISSTLVLFLLTTVLLTNGPNPSPIAQTPPAPQIQPKATPTPKTSPTPTPQPKTPPAPPKPLRLTPEQRLLAAIQDQVAEITNQYADGLIRSIQADFLGSRLVVTLGAGWYDLAANKQNQVANEVLERSHRLDFTKVELLDENGDLVARNPIVGSEMVILQREAAIAPIL
ncbi:hypothetical protein VB712_08135 [Spirulina sp. CCNP1310]|uniref:hypothetical protein n=1 Tax=Spirulina sp. CCNP1310 TaxID=3110249 RepID=UPI002B2018C4|nr:hypothetical protein [Spirulina sp. CCNP1310]MEA5419197.1 hypothetical protein [Spirulina sp. CCNP1310]